MLTGHAKYKQSLASGQTNCTDGGGFTVSKIEKHRRDCGRPRSLDL